MESYPECSSYKVLDVIANLIRSVPFLILRRDSVYEIDRRSYGPTATNVPLVSSSTIYCTNGWNLPLKEVTQVSLRQHVPW